MLSDNEVTNRGAVERSPFVDAYLRFDQHVFKAIHCRDDLLRALVTPTVANNDLRTRADQVFDAWEAAEQAVGRMDETKQPEEQPLHAQASHLLDENGELTADVLERVTRRLADEALIARMTALRERALLRRPPTTGRDCAADRTRP